MTRTRFWAARGASALGVLAPALFWLPGQAAAGFLAGAAVSATYRTAVLAAPTGVVASVSGGTVTVSWVPSASPPSAGTEVLRSGSAGGPYAAVGVVTGATSMLADTPGPGLWYYTAESYTAGWSSPAAPPVAVSVAATPTLRGEAASGSSTSGPAALTLLTTTPVPAGDLLVVRTAIGSSVPVASITDAAGDVYVRQAAVSDRNDLTSELWTATVASPLAAGSPIVVSWSGISGAREAVIADDFASVTGAADGSGTAYGRGSSPSATTPSITGDLVVAVTAADASPADAYTEAAGWTELGSIGLTGPGNRALSLYGGWRIAASSVTAHDPSLSASAKWTEGDVALRP